MNTNYVKKKVRELSLTIVFVFFFSYLLNFVWESFHAVFLYENHNFYARKYVPMLSHVAAEDGLLIEVIYFVNAGIWRDLFWIKNMNKNHVLAIITSGIILALTIEYFQIYVFTVWKYTSLMPTIFGIGISPLSQLSITGIIVFWLIKRILYQKGIFYDS